MPLLVLLTGAGAAWTASELAGALPLVWLVLLVALLALPVRERRLIDPGWLAAGLAALLLSFLVSLDHELALRHVLLFLGAALLAGLARRAAPSRDGLSLMALALAATTLVAAGQVAGGLQVEADALGGLPAGDLAAASARLATGRAFGTASLPGHYAALLLMALPLLITRAWSARRAARLPWLLAGLASVAGILATRSVAALLVAAALLGLALWPPRRTRVLLAVTGLGIIAAIAVIVVVVRTDSLQPLALRWINWKTTWWAFSAHPWLGVGLGGVGQAGLVSPYGAVNITPYTHNTYLQLLAELGLAGAGVLVAALIGLLRLIARGLATERALALAVAVLPLHNLVDFSAYAPEVLLPWAVLVGALAARVLPLPSRPVPAPLLIPVLATGLILSTLGWRAEAEAAAAVGRPAGEAAAHRLAAARWAPWRLDPVLHAAESAAALDNAQRRAIEAELENRWWVRPRSATWAEARAWLLLSLGRRGEALTWAREAQRRAPLRAELEDLERACGGR